MAVARKAVQISLRLSPGAEPWIIVKHDRGYFLIPGDASALELLEGAEARWVSKRSARRPSEAMVRVPLSILLELQSRPRR